MIIILHSKIKNLSINVYEMHTFDFFLLNPFLTLSNIKLKWNKQ